MKDKIYHSLNSIVPSDSQKEYMYKNITRPRNKVGGYILKTCAMATCFMFTFLLFSKETSIENNNSNNMPRTINYDCQEEQCEERN